MQIICCFIKKEYFVSHPNLIKVLDSGNPEKQSRRTHMCVKITSHKNDYYIPLRNNLGADIRKYGRIGHSVPSASRPNAGLDYRYALLINDMKYIEVPQALRIPNSQHRILVKDAPVIEAEFSQYLEGFIKALRKERIEKEPLYRESSLCNYIEEL